MAFRAWNRGLAVTGWPFLHNAGPVSVAYGVWLYNGSNWFPDPTFPGSAVCPGSTILWAGKLDYWLIGPSRAGGAPSPERTLCRFDGVNLQWEPLSLPAATLARFPPSNFLGSPAGGINSGACYAWNNCWFFGDDGVAVHWDGRSLSDASSGLGVSPWLEGDFTSAVAGTDSTDNAFGLAVTRSSVTLSDGSAPLPTAPDGSAPIQLYEFHNGLAPLASPPAYYPPASTDLTMASADSQGDVWVAGTPATGQSVGPAPFLTRLTDSGTSEPCAGSPSYSPGPGAYTWSALSTFPDGSAVASGGYVNSAFQFGLGPFADREPVLVGVSCAGHGWGTSGAGVQFRIPDPTAADQQNGTPVPADFGGTATAVVANASNDAWAATSDGAWAIGPDGSGGYITGALRPHFYHWTDGQPPDAVAGDDNESRPSLFTLDAPVYQVGAPTVVVTPATITTTQKSGRPTRVKLPPAVYAIKSSLVHSPNGVFTLYITFKLRRPVTIGAQALRGSVVVASSGLKRFTGHSGRLALTLDRRRWPTRLRFVTPRK
jgi:hypothetical protein